MGGSPDLKGGGGTNAAGSSLVSGPLPNKVETIPIVHEADVMLSQATALHLEAKEMVLELKQMRQQMKERFDNLSV